MEGFLEDVLKEGYDLMQKAIEHLDYELSHIRAGKASPDMLSDITVEAYSALPH
ncbi:MAG: hypothetical protein R2771_06345 [Saprospiraceae bacterium]